MSRSRALTGFDRPSPTSQAEVSRREVGLIRRKQVLPILRRGCYKLHTGKEGAAGAGCGVRTAGRRLMKGGGGNHGPVAVPQDRHVALR